MDNMCMHRNKSEWGDWWFWWLSAVILIIRTKNVDYDEMWSVWDCVDNYVSLCDVNMNRSITL